MKAVGLNEDTFDMLKQTKVSKNIKLKIHSVISITTYLSILFISIFFFITNKVDMQQKIIPL
ncbi:MAG: hypothetical protein WC357_09815 [Candidatus Omnitrophota bacterium]